MSALPSLFSAETRRDPFPLYTMARAAGAVLYEPHGGTWLVLDHEGVRRVLQDHATFSSAVAGGPRMARWLLFADPPRHTRLRALISRAFTSRAVAALEPRIREISHSLLQRHLPAGGMDLVADYAVPLPLLVIAELLGAPAADLDRFRRWSDTILGLAHTVAGDDQADAAIDRFVATHDEMDAYVARLVAERRASPRDDLLTALISAEVDGDRLDPDDVLGFFQLLLLAGHETTTNLIDNAVLCLLEHPTQLARVRAAPALLGSAIEEVLRFRSPVQAVFRQARHDVVIGGRTIPAGALVLAMIGAANRDPARFDHPDAFDVGRDPNPHLAFGFGIHFCVGAPLSRLEARIALGDLLALDHLALAEPGPWEPREAFNVHGPCRLRLGFAPTVQVDTSRDLAATEDGER